MKALWRASICTAATFDIQLHAGEGKETPVCAGDADESKTVSLSSLRLSYRNRTCCITWGGELSYLG
ncbi:hypothetical protein KOW79_004237 [Hemibagrus wyckioides]|uniref:Uncharacterized protein n=1 Tax=Hemibagrus wyckioides TaxID=337641 RepID=A0A9D3SV51_9TELE|nr:hypothetical protein KOW79_004237 [Hemibagrus wyckioides]